MRFGDQPLRKGPLEATREHKGPNTKVPLKPLEDGPFEHHHSIQPRRKGPLEKAPRKGPSKRALAPSRVPWTLASVLRKDRLLGLEARPEKESGSSQGPGGGPCEAPRAGPRSVFARPSEKGPFCLSAASPASSRPISHGPVQGLEQSSFFARPSEKGPSKGHPKKAIRKRPLERGKRLLGPFWTFLTRLLVRAQTRLVQPLFDRPNTGSSGPVRRLWLGASAVESCAVGLWTDRGPWADQSPRGCRAVE
mmetsp:Transcript_7734/g.27427  ORF Transcript_7734/g.27427 Transcript_7734/m.27427 type:complete len:250 (+) Transcript_7734:1162-1911(+)